MTPKYTLFFNPKSPMRMYMPEENEIVSDYMGMTIPSRKGMYVYVYEFVLTVRWVRKFVAGTIVTEINATMKVDSNVRIEWSAQNEIAVQIVYDTLMQADQKVLLIARQQEPIFQRVPHQSEERNRKHAIDLLSSLFSLNN